MRVTPEVREILKAAGITDKEIMEGMQRFDAARAEDAAQERAGAAPAATSERFSEDVFEPSAGH